MGGYPSYFIFSIHKFGLQFVVPTSNCPQFQGNQILSLILASRFRCNNSSKSLKDNRQILRGKLSKCHISKSACELQNRGAAHRSSIEEAAEIVSENKIVTTPAQHDVLARHATVVQKTQAFFSSLKVRRRGNITGFLHFMYITAREEAS